MRHDVIAWPTQVKPPARPHGVLQTTTNDDKRRQMPESKNNTALYTMRRRTSNKFSADYVLAAVL